MRILAIRVGRVGDTIMMTPALAALLEIYPEARLTVIASPEGARLLKNYHPRLEAIWVWNRYGLQARADRARLTRMIAEADFDLVFCFDTNPGIAKITTDSRAKVYIQQTLGHPVRFTITFPYLNPRCVKLTTNSCSTVSAPTIP